MALRLTAQADALGGAALDGLAVRFPPMAGYDERQMARTREDLVFIVQFLAATLLAADQAVFGDFLDWPQNLLVQRGVPPQALIAGLEALRPAVEAVDTGAALLLDLGRQELLDGRADPVLPGPAGGITSEGPDKAALAVPSLTG